MAERAKKPTAKSGGSQAERRARAKSASSGKATTQARSTGAGRRVRSAPELVLAVPKGRVLHAIAARLERAGIDKRLLLSDDRTLIRDDHAAGVRFLLLKPDDVPTYVEYGSADLGIVGRDILLEREYDLYAPLDLGIGMCRMVVAGKPGQRRASRTLRVATKFVNVARRYFLEKGEQVDIVYVQSSVELAPLLGLADVIVDLVESGETLRQNGLSELESICDISSVVVANRVALKLKRTQIARLLAAIG